MTDVIMPGALTLDKINELEAEAPTPKGAYKNEWNSFATSNEPFRIVTNRVFKGKTEAALKSSFSRYLEPHLKMAHWPEMSVLVAKGTALGLSDEGAYAVLVNEKIRREMELEAAQSDEN